ncbi:MAG: tetratricopeptide repeat protein [Rhodocyclaceae bacterium]|nr:tetratricopeptide repeat protein [Rhodocyclaceae bacterium]
MAVYDLEEQEQISQLKAWWERWGTLITALAIAFAVVTVSWRFYGWYQNHRSTQAAQLYFAFAQNAVTGQDMAAMRKEAAELRTQFPKSHYAVMAALDAARVLFEEGEFAQAGEELGWVQANARDGALRDLARLRHAVVLAQQKDFDGAHKQLQPVPAEPMLAARFNDTLGDVFAAEEKPQQAREAWQNALDLLAANGVGAQDPRQSFIRLKLDSISGS